MNASRRLLIALCVSLALNVFAAGFVVARALHRQGDGHERKLGAMHEGPRHGPFLGPRGLLGLDAGAPAEPAVAALMKRHGEAFHSERLELRKARRAVHDALTADVFDAAKLEAALSGLRARTGSSQARMHVALVELARSLPIEQRRRLAKRARAFELPEPHGMPMRHAPPK